MADLEVLALDTTVPQIRAPGAGDGYSVPRNMSLSANLTFSSTGQRITGDMSNATIANRLAFQTSTTNGNTVVNSLPNGTATTSGFRAFNNSDPTNAAYMQVSASSSEVQINSVISGTGTYLPMTFYTGGSERVRIDTSGNVGIGTASPNKSSSSTAITVNTGTAANYSAVEWASGNTLNYHINANDSAIYHVAAGTRPWIVYTNGSERMRIDSSGNVGIGGTASAFDKVTVTGTLPTSSNISIGYGQRGTIPSGTTSQAASFSSYPSTQAASFTLNQLVHYWALQNTIGAGSTVTNQIGFNVDSSLTGATNNYGFYSNIASGSNRWNLYCAGTANSYFAGNVGIADTGLTNVRLRVKGSNTASSDYTIYSENSAATPLFYVQNDGKMSTGTAANSPYNLTSASAANVYVDSSGVLYRSTSSLRYKSDVTNATHGLADVLKLRSVTYKGKNDGDTVLGGLIAEEVHDAGLTEFVAYDKEGRPDALHYGNMVALLVKAVQELKAELDVLKGK